MSQKSYYPVLPSLVVYWCLLLNKQRFNMDWLIVKCNDRCLFRIDFFLQLFHSRHFSYIKHHFVVLKSRIFSILKCARRFIDLCVLAPRVVAGIYLGYLPGYIGVYTNCIQYLPWCNEMYMHTCRDITCITPIIIGKLPS